MLHLDDPKWQTFEGAYRTPYDASIALKKQEAGKDVWNELWEELHHQGDLGIASYAAIPHLVRIASSSKRRDWNFYGLVSTIEVERHRKSNPTLPKWLATDYKAAWADLFKIAISDLASVKDSSTIQAILATLALAKGALLLGAHLSGADESEIEELVEERCAWSELYVN
jgi:hypothetical protein